MIADRSASAERVMSVTDLVVHWVALGTVIVLALLAVVGIVGLLLEIPVIFEQSPLIALEQLFSGILLLFILLELYQIGRLYFLSERVIDKVFEVGIVALVRQLIVAEFLHYTVQQLLAIAGLVLSLGISWYFTRRVRSGDMRIPVLERPGPSDETRGVSHDDVTNTGADAQPR
jgi:uncharacterized membrane protein (DUF373 family)